MPIRVLLVDDDPMVCMALRLILESTDDLECVGEVHDGDEVISAVHRHFPDVILMDVRMNRVDGMTATSTLQALPNPPRVLVLTTFAVDEGLVDAVTAGARGYLPKSSPPAELLGAIRSVARGEGALSPEGARHLIQQIHDDAGARRRREAQSLVGNLTPRELAVVKELVKNKSNAQIAADLFMGEATVKTHLASAQAKLGAAGRIEVAMIVDRAGVGEE